MILVTCQNGSSKDDLSCGLSTELISTQSAAATKFPFLVHFLILPPVALGSGRFESNAKLNLLALWKCQLRKMGDVHTAFWDILQ
jgi:hypothetical protein